MADLVISAIETHPNTLAAEAYPHVPLPLRIEVENHGAERVNLLGIKLFFNGSGEVPQSGLTLGDISLAPSGSFASGSAGAYPQVNPQFIEAGETGSYYTSVVFNGNSDPLNGPYFTFNVNAQVQPDEGVGNLVSGSVTGSYVTASTNLDIVAVYNSNATQGFQIGQPTYLIYDRSTQHRNPNQTYDFEAGVLQLNMPQGDLVGAVIPNQIGPATPVGNWVSSNTNILSILSPTSGGWGVYTGSVGNPQISGGFGAASLGANNGFVSCSYGVFGASSGSVRLAVVPYLPVSAEVFPKNITIPSSSLNDGLPSPTVQTAQLKVRTVKSSGEVAVVSSSAQGITWVSGDTSVATVSANGVVSVVGTTGQTSVIRAKWSPNIIAGLTGSVEASTTITIGD